MKYDSIMPEVIKDYLSGMRTPRIAEKYNFPSANSVWYALKKHGVKIRKVLPAEKMSYSDKEISKIATQCYGYKDLGERLHYSGEGIKNYCKRHKIELNFKPKSKKDTPKKWNYSGGIAGDMLDHSEITVQARHPNPPLNQIILYKD